jgi:hypothetical protein
MASLPLGEIPSVPEKGPDELTYNPVSSLIMQD